ncbi:response regulator [Sphingobacterium detergens]|uniref:LuxR family two component transcriptional regulator n=1 Tax=Sphingobacterium detergens TaxID=1145106 RepID=A0A420BG33_SPHD1|nr:response regulator transcription factor [Sphingobacterium detergens]RKE55649.1 LuxR family two component transcriptional regulator [Sphingobacterium detergens]
MLNNDQKLVSVVIVDDHPVVIEGFKNVVNNGEQLVLKNWFTSALDFQVFMEEETADIVLLDITLPDGNGIQLCRELKQKQPQIIVLAISNLSERSIIQQMLQSGANGYLLKTAEPADILSCIKRALAGEIVLSREVNSLFDLKALNEPAEIPELTKRERQILNLIAKGKKSAQIAEELFISPLTVKTHRATLLQKFETGNIVIAINKARIYGLLE